MLTHFHGSYLPEDVIFLLKPVDIQSTSIEEKEKLIQSGEKHYSEMLTKETLPSLAYLELFRSACELNIERMAKDCLLLAFYLQKKHSNGVTLVSLARAGTPVGVIVHRLLKSIFKANSVHYSISIIRDKGIDSEALKTILSTRSDTSIVFIDGWTGKGVISKELIKSVTQFNHDNGTSIDSGLYVLADLAGSAKWAATSEDYLIPSSILNATVSGLISRSILNSNASKQAIAEYHGCYFYKEFLEQDVTLSFKNQVIEAALALYQEYNPNKDPFEFLKTFHLPHFDAKLIQKQSKTFIKKELQLHQITDENLIKPSIGEATRVLLRRDPYLVIVKNKKSKNIQHLLQLALEKQVPVEERSSLPYEAVSIIKVKQQ